MRCSCMIKKEEIIDACKEIFIKNEVLTDEEDICAIEKKVSSLDSLTNVTILIEIEEKFGFTIPDEYLSENVLSNIDSLVGLIQEFSTE